jgi:sugar/nucleoside kinase (ribokinase family)
MAVSSTDELATTQPPVVCAGLVVADHVCPPLDHLPRPGELIATDKLILNIGGGAANTAVDLTTLGVPTAICARVGNDIFGRFATEVLKGHGVDCKALSVDDRAATSQTLIVNVKGQDRRFIHYGGANGHFIADDLDAVLTTPPRVLHIGYFLILPLLEAHALAERLKKARAAGTVVMLDVATPGPGDYLGPLATVLPHTDVFVPNCDEAELILGENDPVIQARRFHEMGAQRVVITCGDRGVVSVSNEHSLRIGVYPISYVDGSGGGDAFNAGYIAGLLEGKSEIECLKLASAVGASCVRAVGTTEGVFTRGEAEEFVRQNELSIEPI